MGSQQTIEEGKRQVSTLWRGDLRGSPSPFPFIENGTDPTSLTVVGNSTDSPEPILSPFPATGHDAEILDVEDPYLSYDAEIFPYQQP
jgi:hypothetical protein